MDGTLSLSGCCGREKKKRRDLIIYSVSVVYLLVLNIMIWRVKVHRGDIPAEELTICLFGAAICLFIATLSSLCHVVWMKAFSVELKQKVLQNSFLLTSFLCQMWINLNCYVQMKTLSILTNVSMVTLNYRLLWVFSNKQNQVVTPVLPHVLCPCMSNREPHCHAIFCHITMTS